MNLKKIQQIKTLKPFTLLDFFIILAVIIILAATLIVLFNKKAQTVEITSPDFSYTFPLNKDRTITLDDLIIHIKGGEVWVSDADCPDKLCEHTGKISRVTQMIVCLPNNIVIKITGKSDLNAETGMQ